ncbi:MAG: DNA-3-methyladenine glycosylase 2 family protein [Clostridia bacterium]|nr:DNA-3-methyladenine glycosylase 2 family protein [Clostridia bacterium]
MDLTDTLECGQAFRYECTAKRDGYVEYITVVGDIIVRVGQRARGELIFFGITDDEFESTVRSYFSLDTDYKKIREEISERTDSDWLKSAADEARGIVILSQEPWEALFSFIISQNNNIPRIRKIIRAIAAEYGDNLAISRGLSRCPLQDADFSPSEEKCSGCGICYSFPRPEDVAARPEGLLPSHPGFRYKYLIDAAEKVASGECDLSAIMDAKSYEVTLTELKKICGVGDKVASCTALFGFGNLEAFPIDVWMKRAIDTYFDGSLDPKTLGKYAGVAQQYIFHKIRNIDKNT